METKFNEVVARTSVLEEMPEIIELKRNTIKLNQKINKQHENH